MIYGVARSLQRLPKKPQVAISEIDDKSHAHDDCPNKAWLARLTARPLAVNAPPAQAVSVE
jgi:hypothetical protein